MSGETATDRARTAGGGRLAHPTVGPWDPPEAICEWVVVLEREVAAVEGDPDRARILERRIAAAECWLHDAGFPGPEPSAG